MNSIENSRSPYNSGRSAIVDSSKHPLDTPPNPPDRGASDESRTNEDDTDLVVVEEPDMLALVASRIPGKALNVDALVALVTAADALLSARLIEQARPIVRELRSALEGAQEPRARVIDLSVERSKRET